MNKKIENERFFSIELESRSNLKNVTLIDGEQGNVLVEGSIGELDHTEFTEDLIFEVEGDKGVLRINLSPDEIKQKPDKEK